MLLYYEKKGLVFGTLLAFSVLVLLAHPAAPGSVRRPWVSVTAAPVTLAAATDVGARIGGQAEAVDRYLALVSPVVLAAAAFFVAAVAALVAVFVLILGGCQHCRHRHLQRM